MRILAVSMKGPETGSGGTAAPKVEEVRKNRFADLFTGVAFVTPKNIKPYEFKTGTMAGTFQTRLADAVVYVGKDTGMVIAHCGVVHRKYPGTRKPEILFQWPTVKIGPMSHPVFNTDNAPGALKDLNDIGLSFLRGPFLKWRGEQVAQGATAPSSGGIEGIALDADTMAAFNLGD